MIIVFVVDWTIAKHFALFFYFFFFFYKRLWSACRGFGSKKRVPRDFGGPEQFKTIDIFKKGKTRLEIFFLKQYQRDRQVWMMEIPAESEPSWYPYTLDVGMARTPDWKGHLSPPFFRHPGWGIGSSAGRAGGGGLTRGSVGLLRNPADRRRPRG